MKHYKIFRLSIGTLLLAFSLASVTQAATWESHLQAGMTAYQQGNYAKAEQKFSAALEKAKKFGPQDPRLATTLNNLAALYVTQGKYAEAESLYKRALAIWEKALGPEHPHVATSLENYAALLRKTNRKKKAKKLEARAKAIRAKQAQ